MQHKFYIYREKRGLGHPETAALVKKAAAAALRAEGVDEPCEIGVTLTNDEGIHAINREQRGVDRPTDVLSFPIDEMDYDHSFIITVLDSEGVIKGQQSGADKDPKELAKFIKN